MRKTYTPEEQFRRRSELELRAAETEWERRYGKPKRKSRAEQDETEGEESDEAPPVPPEMFEPRRVSDRLFAVGNPEPEPTEEEEAPRRRPVGKFEFVAILVFFIYFASFLVLAGTGYFEPNHGFSVEEEAP